MHTEQGPQDRSYVANAHALACKVLQLCFRKLFGAQKGLTLPPLKSKMLACTYDPITAVAVQL